MQARFLFICKFLFSLFLLHYLNTNFFGTLNFIFICLTHQYSHCFCPRCFVCMHAVKYGQNIFDDFSIRTFIRGFCHIFGMPTHLHKHIYIYLRIHTALIQFMSCLIDSVRVNGKLTTIAFKVCIGSDHFKSHEITTTKIKKKTRREQKC